MPLAALQTSSELQAVALSSVLRSFYTSLFTLKTLAMPNVDRISSRTLRAEARQGVARRICEAYEELYIGTKELGVATHTPDQVRLLLE